ncbi:MAG: DUF294 nucleotidyltransferase-like domain-containing protein [Gemmatimonadota bacterium]
MPAPTIVAGLKQILDSHAPFSQMAPADLDFLVSRVEVAYFAPGETVLAPSADVPPHFYVVKQGQVRGLRDADPRKVAFEGGAGECFPVTALLAARPAALTYVAVGDTFCLQLARADFEELTRRSRVFLDFCKRRLAALLDLSRQQVQASYAAEASAERTMGMQLADLVRGPPVTCRPDDSLREAFERMHAAHVGSILVTESAAVGQGGERLRGILTRSDLIGRVILPSLPLTTPVRAVMTPDVIALAHDATAADATLIMAENSIRHVPVLRTVDGASSIVGLVSERDLFTLHRLTVRQLASSLRRADSVESLATVAADVRRLSHHLVAQGIAAAQLTRLISHLNDQLTARLLSLACARFGADPDAFCWLALGSEGRGEQTISTDQDNGIIFAGDQGDSHRWLGLADWVNSGLAECGFPLCKGNVMARNPQWCLTAAQWDDLFATWIDRGDPESLLAGSIFFDFRGIFGSRVLAADLRQKVTERAARNSRFLKQMSDNALRNRPPAPGMFESLLGADKPETVDLKLSGTVPFVDAARIWALAAGLGETRTTDRFRRLRESGRLPGADVAGWIDAFEFLQLLRLRRQHQLGDEAGSEAGQNPNRIDTGALSPLDRRILKEAFRQARKLQQRLELDYPG